MNKNEIEFYESIIKYTESTTNALGKIYNILIKLKTKNNILANRITELEKKSK